MKKTKIVCTIGPSTDDENIMRELMKNGMDVARFNFSHSDHSVHKARFETVCKLREELGVKDVYKRQMYNSVYSQAKMGKAVSLKNIEAGDLIICNNYGHVAMYIGGGKIVHAMSTYYGIRIQPLANIKYCGKINTIRRIL